MARPARIALFLLAFIGWPAAPAFAGQARPTEASKWEIEVHGGGLFSAKATDGKTTALPVAETFTTVAGLPSRRASSWMFGDGAALLNQIAGTFGGVVSARITPLDTVLANAATERSSGGSFGFRVGRRLTRRFSAEFNFDYSGTKLGLQQSAVDELEKTRASFVNVWSQILTGPFANPNVTATTEVDAGSGGQVVTTGALNFRLKSNGAFVPYATAGLGGIFNTGTAPGFTLRGNYTFQWLGVAPFNESDRVTMRFTRPDRALVGLVGGGFTYDMSARHGLRVDFRVHLSPNVIDTEIDASPAVITGTPTTTFARVANPSLQFSNSATSTNRSTFSGPAMTGFKTRESSGMQMQTAFTAGYFFRLGASRASGSAPARTAPRSTPARVIQGGRWEIDVHGGGLFSSNPTGGTAIASFPVGQPLGTGGTTMNTRAVSSWYFGDGLALMNQASSVFGVGARIASLDPTLKQTIAERGSGGTVGFRLSRNLTDRFSAEFNFDYSKSGARLTQAAEDAIELSRSSFAPAWLGLLSTGGTQNRVATSTADIDRGGGHQLFVTGALNIHFADIGPLAPYVTVGGGGIFNRETAVRAALTGKYSFSFGGIFPIDETDTTVIHTQARDSAPVGVFGGGFRYHLSAKQGLRVDVRLHLNGNPVDTLVDASPSVSVLTPAFAVVTSNPGVQFSNNPTITGRRSSLSGPAVVDLKTFTASGVQRQVNLSVGYFFRF